MDYTPNYSFQQYARCGCGVVHQDDRRQLLWWLKAGESLYTHFLTPGVVVSRFAKLQFVESGETG